MTDITTLLSRATAGDATAANELMPKIYSRLRDLASRQLARENDSPSIATTGLVHDAYLSLFGNTCVPWRDRGHFFAYAARAMRNLLVDRARRRLAEKHGAGAQHLELEAQELPHEDACLELLALDRALRGLAETRPRLVQVVELRFFAGLSVEETAAGLGVDPRTVERDWRLARTIIHAEMRMPD